MLRRPQQALRVQILNANERGMMVLEYYMNTSLVCFVYLMLNANDAFGVLMSNVKSKASFFYKLSLIFRNKIALFF